MAKIKGAVKTLLDIDGVVGADALKTISTAASLSTVTQTK
jgi:hypothetical protein